MTPPSWPPQLPQGLRQLAPAAFRPQSPLLLALIAAALLHGLAISFGQLRAARRAALTTDLAGPGNAPLATRDDTPELLRLGRRLSQENGLAPLMVPLGDPLPPPPPALEGDHNQRSLGSGSHGRTKRAASRPPRSRAAAASDQVLAKPPSGSAGDAADPGETALGLIEQARRQLNGGKEGNLLRADAIPRADGILRADGSVAAAWQQLWDSAATGGEPPPGLTALGAGSELRRLPKLVLLGDRLLLVWRDGSGLWLVKVSREARQE